MRTSSAERLPIVLLVDPVAASRLTMWRLLDRRFGVLEAPDARGALEWLARRPEIDALVVQKRLPDGDGPALLRSIASRGSVPRVMLVDRDEEATRVVTRLASWFGSASRTAASTSGKAGESHAP